MKRDEMSPPRHECKPCHVQERHTADDDDYGSFISPTISGKYPDYFWMTSLTGIAYAWKASFRQSPMSFSFNELDKGGARRLFMFREFEKTAEKETPGGCFFVKLFLSSPRKHKTMLERTARSLRPRSTFHK